MSRALVLGEEQRELIRYSLAMAREKPVSLDYVIANRLPNESKVVSYRDKPTCERPPSVMFELPVGFTVAISIEEQPAGRCKHLSVSVDAKGALPPPAAFRMIAAEFGMDCEQGLMWIEEFAPGRSAVNLVTLDEPTDETKH